MNLRAGDVFVEFGAELGTIVWHALIRFPGLYVIGIELEAV